MAAAAVKIQTILEATAFILQQLSHCKAVGEGDEAKSQQVDQEISHDLLLEQGTQGDIAPATQKNRGKDHLAEGQQDDSTEADESDLLDHGLTLLSHCVPLDPGHIGTEVAENFLEALGFGHQGVENCIISGMRRGGGGNDGCPQRGRIQVPLHM